MISRWWLKPAGYASYRIADVEGLRQRCNRQAAEIEVAKEREAKLIAGLAPVYAALSKLAQLQLDPGPKPAWSESEAEPMQHEEAQG